MEINEIQRWHTLYQIARSLQRHEPLNLSGAWRDTLHRLGDALGIGSGCIITFDDVGGIADAYAMDVGSDGTLWQILLDRGLIGFVHHGQRTIVIHDISTDPRWPSDAKRMGGGSAVGVPLRNAKGDPFGVLMFVSKTVDGFNRQAVELIEEVASLLSQTATTGERMQTVREEGARYQWLFDDAITPVIITDIDGIILDANRQACRFLGYERDAMVGMNINRVHRPERGIPGLTTGDPMQTNRLSSYRTTAWTANDRQVPVKVKMRKRNFEGRAVIEWVEQDISRELELEKLRDDLTAMVYHDMRGPLQNVSFSLKSLERLLPETTGRIGEVLSMANNSVDQLSRMVASLLDIQRLENGHDALKPEVIGAGEIVASVVELARPFAVSAQRKLRLEVADDLPNVKVDRDMIHRVIINLIENALKYTEDNDQVTLRVEQISSSVRVCVVDTGPGIPPEMRDRIFDKFSRVKPDDGIKGVGLGLAFCRLAVEAHGGRIWVESELGSGSSFNFILPISRAPFRAGGGSDRLYARGAGD